MELTGKTIVVTGAGRGLGRKMAQMMASKGARLALAGLSLDNLEETVQLCRDAGGEARCYQLDVADEDAVVEVFSRITDEFGAFDGVVNNAGINRDALLVKVRDGKLAAKMQRQDWNAVIQVDLQGVFLCGREAAEQMIRLGKGGVIINVSSISRAGNLGQTNYAAAKAGVVAMTVTWAQELGRYGIRVAALAPGFVNTRMVANMPDKVRQKVIAKIPLGRLAEPEEMGHSIIYLFENDYFTGRVLEVDGGLRL